MDQPRDGIDEPKRLRQLRRRSHQDLLASCREAKTSKEQSQCFQDLVWFLQQDLGQNDSTNREVTSSEIPPPIHDDDNDDDDDDDRDDDQYILSSSLPYSNAVIVKESIVRSLLTEWPYSQLSEHIDRILDECGLVITISTCSVLLKEIATFAVGAGAAGKTFTPSTMSTTSNHTSSVPSNDGLDGGGDKADTSSSLSSGESWTVTCPLPLRSVVQACWMTIQRMLLQRPKASGANDDSEDRHNNNNNDDDDDDAKGYSSATSSWDPTMDNDDAFDDDGWKQFVGMIVMLLPQTIANACHVVSLQVPLQSTPSYLYPQMVYTAIISIMSSTTSTWTWMVPKDHFRYIKILLQTLLQKRRSEYVAKGLFLVQRSATSKTEIRKGQKGSSMPSHHHRSLLVDAVFMSRLQLSPFEMASLILALLQQMDHYDDNGDNVAVEADATNQATVLQTCRSLFTTASLEHQEAIVEQLVFSKTSSSSSKKDERWSSWIVQVLADASDSTVTPDGETESNNHPTTTTTTSPTTFLHHLTTIADRWSQWTFVQEVEGRQQHHVSVILWQGLATIPTLDETEHGDLLIALVQGVSYRLESSFHIPRTDGMRVAQQLARGLGQEIHFDEVPPLLPLPSTPTGIERTQNDKDDTNEKSSVSSTNIEQIPPRSVTDHVNSKKSRPVPSSYLLDPDAEYDSADEDSTNESFQHAVHDEDDNNAPQDSKDGNDNLHNADDNLQDDDNLNNNDDDDGSVQWDEDLIPYDLHDDEDDLMETPKPLHLVEALDLLRTGESHEQAYSRHDAALGALTDLIRSRPDDLPDIAVSLALELVRMENKFQMVTFNERRDSALRALLVQEPISVGQALINEIFEDRGLADRLNIFAALQGAAYELSGMVTDPSRDQKLASTSGLLPVENSVLQPSEQVSRVISNTRQKRSRRSVPKTIRNHFTSVAPMWFYSMISEFLKNKEKESLWTGSTGTLLLAHFFRCLASIVEFSGVLCSQVLAADLLNLVWEFRTADVAEVRLGVLVSVATAIAMLPEERVISLLLEDDASLPTIMHNMSLVDPDTECRHLSLTISRSIRDVLASS